MKNIFAIFIYVVLCGCSRQTKLEGAWDLHSDTEIHKPYKLILHETNGGITGFIFFDPDGDKAWPVIGRRIGDQAQVYFQTIDYPKFEWQTWKEERQDVHYRITIKPEGLICASHIQLATLKVGGYETNIVDSQLMGLKCKQVPVGPFHYITFNSTTGLPSAEQIGMR